MMKLGLYYFLFYQQNPMKCLLAQPLRAFPFLLATLRCEAPPSPEGTALQRTPEVTALQALPQDDTRGMRIFGYSLDKPTALEYNAKQRNMLFERRF